MDFLTAVNRVMRISGILGNDDDDLVSFNDTQHAATSQLAKIAIQSEIGALVAQEVIPYEGTSGEFTFVAGQRLYDLASDFVGFTDRRPRIVKVEAGAATTTTYFEYPGGEEALRFAQPDYEEIEGGIINWYIPTGSRSKQIGIWLVPDSENAGDIYRYYYQADVSVTVTSDIIPLVTEQEAQIFVDMCSRRFKFLTAPFQLREQIFPGGIEKDRILLESRATLGALVNPRRNVRKYGRQHRATRPFVTGGPFNSSVFNHGNFD